MLERASEEDVEALARELSEAAADHAEREIELAWEQMLEEENHKEGREDL
jgi:hypothetical protein